MHKEDNYSKDKTLCLCRLVTVISEKFMRNGVVSTASIKCVAFHHRWVNTGVCVNINAHSSSKSADTANVHRCQKNKSASLPLAWTWKYWKLRENSFFFCHHKILCSQLNVMCFECFVAKNIFMKAVRMCVKISDCKVMFRCYFLLQWDVSLKLF